MESDHSVYFPGRELLPEKPPLFLFAPGLRVHPASDTLLPHLSPEIEWRLLGSDERWRDQLQVIFRKRAANPNS
jgi:hypothetical protein